MDIERLHHGDGEVSDEGSLVVAVEDLPSVDEPIGLAVTGRVDEIVSDETAETLRLEETRAATARMRSYRRMGRAALGW